ncbi:MAG: ribonuclease P protein component [Phycisphaerae bacterium]|nr:ribonuclease P protein component [Gemmatimonadaceae bacterium]
MKVVAEKVARSYAFPRVNRVTRGADIEQVRKEGKRVRTASMDVRAIASLAVSAVRASASRANAHRDVIRSGNTASSDAAAGVPEVVATKPAVARVGVVVPKYGKSSVDRNRLKRRLRELVRIEVLPVLPAMHVVLKTSPRAYTRTFDELREEVRKWTQLLVSGRGLR